jgi:hypothetical protein
VAPDVETRCKCLAYLGWAIIKQRDRSKLDRAWASFDQFEREADGKDIPPILLSLVRLGRAVQYFHLGDLSRAHSASEQAYRLDESNGPARELSLLLRRPEVSAAEALEFILALAEAKTPKPTISQKLPPLPDSI